MPPSGPPAVLLCFLHHPFALLVKDPVMSPGQECLGQGVMGSKRPGTVPPIPHGAGNGGRLTMTVACIMPRRVLTYRLARFEVTVGIPPVSLRRIQTQSTWLTSAVLAPPQENGCARAGSPTREWLSLHDVAIQVPSETLVVLRHAEHRARRQRGGGGAEAKRASSATAQLACLLACFPP